MDKRIILMIDDERDFCKLVKLNLESFGDFEVVTAFTGKEGIKLARQTKPDLILLDVMMPGMDGFEVLERLKKDEHTIAIPVVMLTVKRDDDSMFQASQLFDEDYVTKPVEADELKARIENVLKRKQLQKEGE